MDNLRGFEALARSIERAVRREKKCVCFSLFLLASITYMLLSTPFFRYVYWIELPILLLEGN